MVEFTREKPRNPRGRPNRGNSRGGGQRRDFGGRSRFGDRGPRREKNFEMTKVTCSECQKECEIPFKPRTDKPVFCSDCFESKGNSRSGKGQSIDLTEINEKLDKIMKALKIE